MRPESPRRCYAVAPDQRHDTAGCECGCHLQSGGPCDMNANHTLPIAEQEVPDGPH